MNKRFIKSFLLKVKCWIQWNFTITLSLQNDISILFSLLQIFRPLASTKFMAFYSKTRGTAPCSCLFHIKQHSATYFSYQLACLIYLKHEERKDWKSWTLMEQGRRQCQVGVQHFKLHHCLANGRFSALINQPASPAKYGQKSLMVRIWQWNHPIFVSAYLPQYFTKSKNLTIPVFLSNSSFNWSN